MAKKLTKDHKNAMETLLVDAYELGADYLENDWNEEPDEEAMAACLYWANLAEALERLGVKGSPLNLATNMHGRWVDALAEAAAEARNTQQGENQHV